MDDFVARPDLLSRERLRTLSAKSDAPGLRRLASHFAALGATGIAVWLARGSPWLAPAILAHGVILVFLFCPLHEGVHGTAFRRRWLNDRVADLCGFLTCYPRLYYRCVHFAHHRHTQDPARDPELVVPKPRTRRDYLVYGSGWYYWTGKLGSMIRTALSGRTGSRFVPERMERPLVTEARAMFAGYAAVVAGGLAIDPVALVIYWIGPALIGQPFLRLYLLAEHTGCAETEDMLKNVRTTFAGPFVRWLAWNMPFHAEHHTFPSVPFHALPAVHADIARHLVHTADSHAAFNRDLWRDLAPGRTVAAE